jgi:predicted Zn-dependent protease
MQRRWRRPRYPSITLLVPILSLIRLMYVHENRRWGTNAVELNISTLPIVWQTPSKSAADTWSQCGARFSFVLGQGADNTISVAELGRANGAVAITVTQPDQRNSTLTYARTTLNTHYEFQPRHPHEPHRSRKGPFNLETIVLHELGHQLNLGHSRDRLAVMAKAVSPNSARTVLAADDIAGIKALYP